MERHFEIPSQTVKSKVRLTGLLKENGMVKHLARRREILTGSD